MFSRYGKYSTHARTLAADTRAVHLPPSARLSHPVLRIAGLPDFGWFPIHMSARAAMELHIAGREFSGEEAVQAGLINQVFKCLAAHPEHSPPF